MPSGITTGKNLHDLNLRKMLIDVKNGQKTSKSPIAPANMLIKKTLNGLTPRAEVLMPQIKLTGK